MRMRSDSAHRPLRRTAVGPVAAFAAVLAACGSSSKPASQTRGTPTDAHTGSVTITAKDGCRADKVSLPAGSLTMQIENKDATAVSEVELLSGERIVGEKENLPPGFSGSFAVQVTGGNYTMYFPGAPKDDTTVSATRTAAATS